MKGKKLDKVFLGIVLALAFIGAIMFTSASLGILAHNEAKFYGSTGWGDAISIIPWTLYTHYGDRGILEEAFDAMLRWNDFVWAISDGPIVHPPQNVGDLGFTFGDWLQPQGNFFFEPGA